MKIGLLAILIFSILLLERVQALGQVIGLIKPDSLPSHQTAELLKDRHRFRFGGSAGQPSEKRLFTIVIQPKNLRLGNEITLPVGVDERTVTVRSGDKTLIVWDDYVFIPDTNKMRILDEDVLNSERPIRITYKKLY